MGIKLAPDVWIKKQLTRADYLQSIIYGGRKRGVPKGTALSDLITLKKIIILCWECNHIFYPHHRGEDYKLDPMKANATCDLCRTPSHTANMYVPNENWSTVHADPTIRNTGGKRYEAIPVRNLHEEDKAFLREKLVGLYKG